MPKFQVKKHVDAYVIYDTLVKADDTEAAHRIACDREYAGDWRRSHVAEFDHVDFFPEEIEEVADDFDFDLDLETITKVEFTPSERDGVLSALRLWQKTPEETRAYLSDIFTDGGEHDGLTDEEIDALCERINV